MGTLQHRGRNKLCQKTTPQTQIEAQSQPQPSMPFQSQPIEKNIAKKKQQPSQPQLPAQIIPHLQPKNTPTQPTEIPLSPILLSLSPISTPKLLSRSHLVNRDSTPQLSSSKHLAKSASNEVRRAFNAFYFCEETLESPTLKHQVKKH